MHEVGPEPPLDAQPAVVRCRVERRIDAKDAVVLDVEIDLAPDAAVGTGGTHDSIRFHLINLWRLIAEFVLRRSSFVIRYSPLNLALQRARGTDADAIPAEDARGVGHRRLERGGHVAADAASAPGEREGMLHILGADLDAAPAHDALRVVPDVERVVVFERDLAADAAGKAIDSGTVTFDVVQDLRRLSQVDRGGEQLQDHAPGRVDAVGLGVDDHVLADRDDARRLQDARPHDLHRAQPADGVGGQVGVVAQRRDVDARAPGGLQQGRTRRRAHRAAVDRQRDGCDLG